MKCKYEGFGVWEGRCVGTTEVDPCIGYEKCSRFRGDYPSNADHIRDMSDEELYSVLRIFAENDACLDSAQEDCGSCVFYPFCNSVHCGEDVLDWLKQPYKEASNDTP